MSTNLIEKLKEAVIVGDRDEAIKISREIIDKGLDPLEALKRGLVAGVLEVGEKWVREEVFLADLVMSAEAMKAASEVLKPEIIKRGGVVKKFGKVIIGTVAGDIHDIGKNIVATMLEASGFEVIDLGVDVPTETFVEKVRELKPDVLGLSALLTTTMLEQKNVIEALKREGLRDGVKVIVGGAPVTEEWAKSIGADGYAEDAVRAVRLVKKLLGLEG
ncbi:MAG: corrinoid protein [Sulfolobales archaeon]|nr:corrinoid protein [Sulfolobales archaeon]MCX8198575.1 corrinoid protein [Sulfolobales archaeon]MDW8169649.1 corrinoid protein [Desulfurococcaceae archaeon]